MIDALGIKVIDDQTLEITAPIASAVTQTIFTMWVTWAEPAWAIDANGEFWTEPENINTYGPYALKEWVHGDGGSLTMVKNPFWPGTPNSPVGENRRSPVRLPGQRPAAGELRSRYAGRLRSPRVVD